VSASCLRLMLWLRDDVRFSYSSRPSAPHHARLCGAKVRTTIAITFSSWSPLRIDVLIYPLERRICPRFWLPSWLRCSSTSWKAA
jgi:hypothetical protein